MSYFISNEKHSEEKFVIPNDGEWHRFDVDVKLDFDLAVTELLSVFFCALTPCDELSFRSMSLIKIVDPHCAIITSRRSRGARQ